MVQANEQKSCDALKGFTTVLLGILLTSVLVTSFTYLMYRLLSPAPITGVIIVAALGAGAIIYIGKDPERFTRKAGVILDRIKIFRDRPDWKKNVPDVAFLAILCGIGLTAVGATAVLTGEMRTQHEAAIQSAMEDAPSMTIDGYCVDGKVFIKDKNGDTIMLTANRMTPLPCDAIGKN